MNKISKILFIIVLMVVGIIGINNVKAAVDDITYPDAAFTITDKNNNPIVLQFDYMTNTFTNFPNEGDIVRIFYDGNTAGTADEVFTYSKAKKRFVGDTYTWLRWGVYENDYSTRSVGVRVNRTHDDTSYDSGHYYYIRKNVTVDVFRAPLKSLTYNPSSFRVYSENIKQAKSGGGYFYSFTKRAQHNAGGSKWSSAFVVGDTITATFEDGSTICYTDKDAVGDGGYDDFFVNGDEMFMGMTENYKLSPGDNKVTVYLYMKDQPNIVKTTVDVFMWTPDMGAYPGDYVGLYDLVNANIAGIVNKTYNGKVQKQGKLVVKLNGKTLVDKQDYTVVYKNNVNAGTATMTIVGKGNYTGTLNKTFKINKASNPITVSTKTKKVKYKKVKKKAQVASPIIVTKNRGNLTYVKQKGSSSKLSINKTTGKVTIKKGTKKGTYKIKVKVTAKGNNNYNSGYKIVTAKVKVK